MRWRMHGLGAVQSRRAVALAALALALAAFLLWGRGQTSVRRALAPREATPPLAELDVEYSGCRQVLRGPRCAISPGTDITLWMPASFAGHTLDCGSCSRRGAERAVAGGYQLVLSVSPGDEHIALRSGDRALWQLELAPEDRPAWWAEAERAKNAGEHAQLARLLAPALDAPNERDRLLARGLWARSLLRQGKAAEAEAMFEATAGALLQAGLLSDAARDVFAHVFLLVDRRSELTGARALIERFRGAIAGYPYGRALLAEHDGFVGQGSGELSSALAAYERAQRAYQRLGETADSDRVDERRAQLLGELGLVREAVQQHARLVPPAPDLEPCEQAAVWIEHSWLTLLLAETGDLLAAGRVPELLGAADAAAQRCGEPEKRSSAAINRGLWALAQGDAAQAGAVERELRALPESEQAYLRAWRAELLGRFALARGEHMSAERAFAHERALGLESGQLDAQLRAYLGQAEVLQRQRRADGAEQALQAALALLLREQRLAPLGVLGHTHYAARQRAAQRLVQLLLERGDVPGAYAVAARAYRAPWAARAAAAALQLATSDVRERYRALLQEYRQRREQLTRSLADDWSLARPEREVARARRQAELAELELLLDQAARLLPDADAQDTPPTMAGGDYRLLIFPLERGWVSFGHGAQGVRMARANEPGLPDSASLQRLLEVHRAELGSSRRVLVMPAGEAFHWDFEQLQLGELPLSRLRLAYSLGLSRSAKPEAATPWARPGLVVDPRGDLTFARQEGQLVRQALQVASPQLLQQADASVPAVLELFETVDFLHYAGHARAGPASSAPALLLAGGAELSAWELFGLRRVPRQVVLSACESASVERETRGVAVGWGLAQVLVALGADTVIAPLSELDDAEAFELQTSLYAELARTQDLEEAFYQARQRHRERAGRVDFRLLVP